MRLYRCPGAARAGVWRRPAASRPPAAGSTSAPATARATCGCTTPTLASKSRWCPPSRHAEPSVMPLASLGTCLARADQNVRESWSSVATGDACSFWYLLRLMHQQSCILRHHQNWCPPEGLGLSLEHARQLTVWCSHVSIQKTGQIVCAGDGPCASLCSVRRLPPPASSHRERLCVSV